MTTSELYNNSRNVPFASRLSLQARRQAFQMFLDVMQPTATMRVLDVGVTCDEAHPESNFFEEWYPYKTGLVCVGTEDGSYLEARHEGLRFLRVQAGAPLPFANREFDIAFSNAVLEHVGSTTQQRAFVQEICRVAQRVFITTPNRWFPLEHHTGLPLLHYLPKPVYRAMLRRMRAYRYWSDEANLNALTLHALRDCFPTNYPVCTVRSGIGAGVLRSNLIAYTRVAETIDREATSTIATASPQAP